MPAEECTKPNIYIRSPFFKSKTRLNRRENAEQQRGREREEGRRSLSDDAREKKESSSGIGGNPQRRSSLGLYTDSCCTARSSGDGKGVRSGGGAPWGSTPTAVARPDPTATGNESDPAASWHPSQPLDGDRFGRTSRRPWQQLHDGTSTVISMAGDRT